MLLIIGTIEYESIQFNQNRSFVENERRTVEFDVIIYLKEISFIELNSTIHRLSNTMSHILVQRQPCPSTNNLFDWNIQEDTRELCIELY